MPDTLDLPFDQYQRYELVRALMESVRAPGESFHVLDVGGRTALLRDFLPHDRVELVDVDPSPVDGLILGSGAQLPFRDDTFDVVAAFDTLEHVPPDLREAFVSECGRVAKRYVMLAGPYDAPRVADAEQLLLDFLQTRLEWEHRYLAEHRTNGLPDADATRAGLRAHGAEIGTFGHGALDRWQLLMSLELYIEHEPLLRDLAPRIYRLYNEHLFASDHGSNVYRHAIVGAFGGAKMPSLDDVLEPVGSAPPKVTKALMDVGHEILRYDALRDSFEPEIQRLHGVVADVEKDLVEHKATVETLHADLTESKKTIETLRGELDRERSDARSFLADKQERLGAVESDLEGHRSMVAELNRLRGLDQAELGLRGDLLEAANQRVDTLNADVVLRDQHLSERDLRMREAHERLVGALERVSNSEEQEGRLRHGLASALADVESPDERRAILDGQQLSIEEELDLLIDARDRRLRERDEARDQIAAMAAELLEAQTINEAFRDQATRRWAKLGRALKLQSMDDLEAP